MGLQPGCMRTSTKVFIPGEEPGHEIKADVFIDPNGGLCVDLDAIEETEPDIHERLGTEVEPQPLDLTEEQREQLPPLDPNPDPEAEPVMGRVAHAPTGSRPADEETGTSITS